MDIQQTESIVPSASSPHTLPSRGGSWEQDLEWIDALKAGDPAAMDALVRKYRGNVLRQCLRVVRDEHQAEDLAQEVFLRVFLRIGKYNPSYVFYGWLSRIATNCCIDYLRYRRARPEIYAVSWDATPEIAADPPAHPAGYGDAFVDLADRQLSATVRAAIDQLPERLRTVIRLRELEGYSYKEIGKIMSCTSSAVKSRIYQARGRLRELLAADYSLLLRN